MTSQLLVFACCAARIDVALGPIWRYDLYLRYEWNPTKRAINLAKHGIEFETAEDFEWDTALIEADTRHDYGEERFRALGLIGNRVHVLIYTPRGASRWIIGLRKANLKEAVYYAPRD